jgi:tetratricopeptide (TPR) repeat protein
MASDELPKSGRQPLPDPKRRRLEKVFEVAGKKATGASASSDFDYVTDLLLQCVTGDPGNPIYVRAYIENLQKKYGNNKKGAPLAQFKERGSRAALKKALSLNQWDEAIEHGLKALTVNPWDSTTLTGMAAAAGKTGDRDCEFCYLQSALIGTPKDPALNRLMAIHMTERGLINEAITWWHRVEDALPADDEAKRAIAVLTVQKARSRGEFDADDEKRQRAKTQIQEEATLEQKLLQKIEREPGNLANYLELSTFYINEERYKECEEVLAKAYEVSDGDPDIRDKWEEAEIRHLRQKVSQASDPAVKKKYQDQYFEKDLEVWKHRVERYPSNLAFRYELGYRYMLTKRYSDSIRELQAAKNDPRRKGVCLLVLGQCFEKIGQHRLAMSHYESAIQEIPDREADNKKRALHRAGRLALGLRDLEKAEKHLATLAGLDFTYKDVSALLDKIAKLRENPGSGGEKKPERPTGEARDSDSASGEDRDRQPPPATDN